MLRAAERRFGWSVRLSAHSSAEEFMPILPDHVKYETQSIRYPTETRYVAFLPLTQIFGASDSVINYNVFSRILPSLLNRILALPVIEYFDDLALLSPSSLCDLVSPTVYGFCGAFGVSIKREREREISESGRKVTF